MCSWFIIWAEPVLHICYSSTLDAEAGNSAVQGKHGKHSKKLAIFSEKQEEKREEENEE